MNHSKYQKNKRISGLVKSNWTVTLTATMLGVFAGIYLNNLVADRSLTNQVNLALTKVEHEIVKNNEILLSSYESHKKFYDVLKFLNTSLDENGDLVTKAETMGEFKLKHPKVFNVADSVVVEGEKYKYDGTINFNFNEMPSISITNIAFTTIENSRLTSVIDFECLYMLASIDKVQNRVIDQNDKLYEYLSGKKDMGDRFEVVLPLLRQTMQFEEILIEYYKQNKELKSCK